MALTQSQYQEYDFDRMVVRFTMKDDCATGSRRARRGNSAMPNWRATLPG